MKELIVLILTTWRLSSLLTDENGPYDIFAALREAAGVKFDDRDLGGGGNYGDNEFAAGLICKWCNSVWIGAFITLVLWITGNKLASPALPFALSGGSIVVDRWING